MNARTTKATIGMLAVLLTGASTAGAVVLRTPPMEPGSGQKLVCTVVNLQEKGLEMQAQIVDRFGDNTTDFASTDWNDAETTVVTLRVESSNPNARYCRITVAHGRKADVAGSLQSCTFDESTCSGAVVAR
jgi:S-adenosylmethionine hydrolase